MEIGKGDRPRKDLIMYQLMNAVLIEYFFMIYFFLQIIGKNSVIQTSGTNELITQLRHLGLFIHHNVEDIISLTRFNYLLFFCEFI